MEEKIKIYVSSDVNFILLKDMEFFEFYKKDGQLNKNDFINTLIINYFDTYQERQSKTYNHIKELLKDHISSDLDTVALASEILNYTETSAFMSQIDKTDITISIKPTKKSSGVIEYIQMNCLDGTTMSNYFRNMFTSYTLLPQDKRERIIFKEKFEVIDSAIEQKKKLYFTTKSKPEKHIVSPYAIGNSQEELFNYLICEMNGATKSFRVSRLLNVRVMNESVSFTKERIEAFGRTLSHAPQFAYDEEMEICVRLTDVGVKQYQKIYSYRPKPINVIKNLYYFDCSGQQIIHYFQRFGKHAVILYPAWVRSEMHKFHAMADKEYKKVAQGQ